MWYEWENMKRKFGHCIVTWRIHNFYVMPMNMAWQILSPEFEVRGFQTTKWIMKVMNKQIEKKLYLHLENLDSSKANMHFLGTCNIVISDGFRRPLHHVSFTFTDASSNESICVEHDCLADSYDLCISCQLFIRFRDVDEDVRACIDAGISSLGQDLLTLFEKKQNSDVVLQVYDREGYYDIQAHKPIVSSRITKLKDIFHSNKTALKFVVDHFGQFHEWKNILRFLYTANMKHVLSPPSQIYYDIALTYDIEPIIAFYEPDELVMHSTVLSEEYAITWTLCKFLTREEISLNTSRIRSGEIDARFQVKLYPRSFERENVTCICTEVEGRNSGKVFVEISAVNEGKIDSLAIRYGNIQDGTIFKGYCFVEREILKRYLHKENLTLVFKFNILDIDNLNNSKRCSDKSIIKCKQYSSKDNYSALSRDLMSLHYNADKCEKVNFLIEGEECFIHRCILSARAKYLYNTIKRSKIITYTAVKHSILKELICFLYSGKLNLHKNENDIFDLYDIAAYFRIKSLTKFLLINFESNLKTLPPKYRAEILQLV